MEHIATFHWKGHLIRLSAEGNDFHVYPDEVAGEPHFPSVTIRGRRDETVELVGLITIHFPDEGG